MKGKLFEATIVMTADTMDRKNKEHPLTVAGIVIPPPIPHKKPHSLTVFLLFVWQAEACLRDLTWGWVLGVVPMTEKSVILFLFMLVPG
jgi:hypothetical protein